MREIPFCRAARRFRIVAIRVVNGEAEVVLLNSRAARALSLPRRAGRGAHGARRQGRTVVVTSLRNGTLVARANRRGKSSVFVSDRAVKHSPRFGDSADEIYFVADYGNVDNVWSWRRATAASALDEARNGVRE